MALKRSDDASFEVRVVDCDVHLKPTRPAELAGYLAEPWRSRSTLRRALQKGPVFSAYAGPVRLDARPKGGGAAGSDVELVQRQLFVEAGVDIAINTPVGESFCPSVDPDLSAALASAANQWQAETWLSRHNGHGRFRGSILVPINHPAAAAGEIEKWAGDPRFVQVLIPHQGGAPYGSPRFNPIWEAAARHRLPVAIHANLGGLELYSTPVGYLQRYPEYNAIGYPLCYAAHLVSFLTEGTFQRYPDFRVVFVEGGFSWSPGIVSRLDHNWRALPADVPALTALPSSLLRDHVRFTSQPVEEPEDLHHLRRMYEWGDAEHLLMFSSDYPHWDYDHPSRALPSVLGDTLRRRIYRQNAIDFYGLPERRTQDALDRAAGATAAVG